MNARIIAGINQKGGVDKTTMSSSHLAYALARRSKKVALIDLDPQGHPAVSLGVVSVKLTGTDEDRLGNSWITQQLLTVLVTVIRESAMLAECPSSGNTVIEYRPGSRSARDFI